MPEENNELKDFIKETLRQIKEGNEGNRIVSDVEFDIAVTKSQMKGVDGGVRIAVVDGAGKGEWKDERISRIKFKSYIPSPDDKNTITDNDDKD